uniref:RBR-type E3 ubiquitin transferase n=1 Tax=Phlebotomus kandelakii TaxID=1109342 RepID=A0A6B2E970_9DIPT
MSADSDENEMDSYSDIEDADYYNTGLEDGDVEPFDPHKYDPEYFDYECYTVEEVKKLLSEAVEKVSDLLQLSPSLAKILLHENEWCVDSIVNKYRDNAVNLLVGARIKPVTAKVGTFRSLMCPVCVMYQSVEKFFNLSCCHSFCRDCWATHFDTQIHQGISTGIGCMAPKCDVRVPEDLVLKLLKSPHMRDKYLQFAFHDNVKSHPELRFCPGPNCQIIIRSQDLSPKKAFCRSCESSFCFKCGMEYHAPTDCQVIKKWLTKCADDSETANYISAHTKDCPKCHICIEKNGGCNHMQCYHCKHDFCWMCLGDWKSHGSEYYECSRYKENPNIAHESVHAQAREALKKYLHYYERWENHSKSLQLEQQTLDRLRDRINEKVMKGLGTWIDWQYLFNAAALLAKCRYTLQYTYPYAYYMEAGSRKDLFEYQQANLEAEIENLSWKVERAETTDRGDLENQMDIAEKRRTILLKDFFPTDV